jgi:hypothetical protein
VSFTFPIPNYGVIATMSQIFTERERRIMARVATAGRFRPEAVEEAGKKVNLRFGPDSITTERLAEFLRDELFNSDYAATRDGRPLGRPTTG